MFPTPLFLLSAAAAAHAAALSLLETRETSFGTLSIYGTDTPKTLTTRQNCRKPFVVCDSETNVPDATACEVLAGLIEANPEKTLPDKATSLCITPGLGTCCTTWGEAVPELALGSLLEGVGAMIGACVDPAASGKYVPADLDTVCTVQCLASVPDKCEF